MSKASFHNLSQNYLENILDKVESNYPLFDAELGQDNLMITISNNKTFLITINQNLQQIWLSSPVSGGHHFFYNDTNQSWVSTRDHNCNLTDVLSQEFVDILNLL